MQHIAKNWAAREKEHQRQALICGFFMCALVVLSLFILMDPAIAQTGALKDKVKQSAEPVANEFINTVIELALIGTSLVLVGLVFMVAFSQDRKKYAVWMVIVVICLIAIFIASEIPGIIKSIIDSTSTTGSDR